MKNNNPGKGHGGRLSSLSKNSINYEKNGGEEYRLSQCRKLESRRTNTSYNTKPEYYMAKLNCTLEEATILLSERQSTAQLSKYIDNYGEIKGLQNWVITQNRRLARQYLDLGIDCDLSTPLWSINLLQNGCFYLLDLGDGYYKIGTTTTDVKDRYRRISYNYNILIENTLPFNHAFQIEQILLKELQPYKIEKDEKISNFGWTETFKNINVQDISNKIQLYSTSYDLTLEDFKKEFYL